MRRCWATRRLGRTTGSFVINITDHGHLATQFIRGTLAFFVPPAAIVGLDGGDGEDAREVADDMAIAHCRRRAADDHGLVGWCTPNALMRMPARRVHRAPLVDGPRVIVAVQCFGMHRAHAPPRAALRWRSWRQGLINIARNTHL